MDISLHRDEQFSFTNSYKYMDPCKFSPIYSNDFDDDIRPSPQLPTVLFEWQDESVNNKPIEKKDCDIISANYVQSVNDVQIKQEILISNNDRKESNLEPIQNSEINLIDYKISVTKDESSESSDILNCSFNSADLENFDITEYVLEEEKKSVKKQEVNKKLPQKRKTRVIQSRGKHIDLNSRCYIPKASPKRTEGNYAKKIWEKKVDDDEEEVDIETVTEGESATILQAGNITDLLEQFEATEVAVKCPSVEEKKIVTKVKEMLPKNEQLPLVEQNKPNQIKQKVQKRTQNSKKSIPKTFVQQQSANNSNKTGPLQGVKKSLSTCTKTPNTISNKQIANKLPQELIDRIKQSGKRKTITVIDPIPNKKKCKIQESDRNRQKIATSILTNITLDHSYCSSVPIMVDKADNTYNKNNNNLQPMVKNADGTLMVSILKKNTLKNTQPSEPDTMKTKGKRKVIKLDEYKRLRGGILTPSSSNCSQSCSPTTTSSNSPIPEDKDKLYQQHQEKLRKMYEEVLKATPKSDTSTSSATIKLETPNAETVETFKLVKIEPPKTPDHLERIEYVNFGCNTDFRILNNDALQSIERLQELKPIIAKASDRIDENSLITSVMQITVPKLINERAKINNNHVVKIENDDVHGEGRFVRILPKDRVRCKTTSVSTQTRISLIEQRCRTTEKRKRSISSSSSYSSRASCSSNTRRSPKRSRNRKISESSTWSSRSSRSSAYSSRTYNSSRESSRSRSPNYRRSSRTSNLDRDHLNAVEERRIIYVGRILTGTTKEDLRRKFYRFGPITKISLHFRDIGYNHLENYGFVTFRYKEDAHNAYEHGNDNPNYPSYKISFGGRREFCNAAYSDLDNLRDEESYRTPPGLRKEEVKPADFFSLLKDTLEKIKKRKA